MLGHIAHCPDTALQELAQLRPVVTAAVGQEKTGVDFVADLHHFGEQAFFREAVQHAVGIGIDGIPHPVYGQPLPGGGRYLLAGVGPVIGVMEIQQNLHAGVSGAANGALHVGEGAVPVGRRVPQTNAYEVGAAVGEKDERIHRLPVFAVDPATVFHFVNVGEIGAQHHRIAGGVSMEAAIIGVAAQGVRTIRSASISDLPEMVVPGAIVPVRPEAILRIRKHQGACRKQDAQCGKQPTFSGERRHSERGHSDRWISTRRRRTPKSE